jgi:cohesin loading factor subunit SCC2
VPVVAEKALALHAHLHTKHASLVNIRFLDFARASYDYQRSITAEVSGHRHGQALLQDWYSLISEKRTWRIDLLKSFCRAFDYDVSRKDTVNSSLLRARAETDDQVDIGLVLYLSDNLATFEYKLQDEPMSVVHYLGTVIASCIHLASLLESGKIEGEAQDLIEGKKLVVPNVSPPPDDLPEAILMMQSQEVVYAESAINASIVVCLALATKNHLLGMWSLSEE